MNEAVLAVSIPDAEDRGADGEDALIGRAREGDLRAFEQLYRRHVGRIHALCRRLAGSQARAEDCTQEAFVQAWKALPTFRGEAAFGSWLHRIAVNAVIAGQRKSLRRSAWVSPDGDEAVARAAAPEPRLDLALDLERAVSELPAGAREVFVLFALEGYKHEEIAALTGFAVGTSKAHLHRARRLLRARLTS